MVFNSFNFWLVFPIVFIIYWAIPKTHNKYRNIFLLIVSYLLYLNWKPVYGLILLGVTLVTYYGGIVLENDKNNRRKHLVWCLALLTAFPLLLFKYYNFVNESITSILEAVGLHFSLPGLNWAIPVGISFFTFQALGYMLDVYHGRTRTERNLIDYLLFVSFFPQVTSGPISKADELLPQIKKAHSFSYEQGKEGLRLLLWGMFFKLVVADRLGMYVDTVYANYEHISGLNLLLGSVLYSFQIYGDFAGYSYMAIGIAKLLGFDLVNNFNRPYFAATITEFWRRWHISLTRWLTQQIYIPLGGSRCSKLRCYINIMITFLVSGIWHGANLTFIIWGGIHGLIQIFEKALGINKSEGTPKYILPFRLIFTFIIVTVAWIFFRMPTFMDSINVIQRIIMEPGTFNSGLMMASDMLMLVIGLFVMLAKDTKDEFFKNAPLLGNKFVKWTVYVVLFAMILNFGILDGGSFIYVSF